MSNNLSRAWSQATSCHLEEIMQRKQNTKGIFNEIQCCILQKMSHLLLKNRKWWQMRLATWALKLKENYYKIILRYDMYIFMIKIYLRYLRIQHTKRTYNLETRTSVSQLHFIQIKIYAIKVIRILWKN